MLIWLCDLFMTFKNELHDSISIGTNFRYHRLSFTKVMSRDKGFKVCPLFPHSLNWYMQYNKLKRNKYTFVSLQLIAQVQKVQK